MDRKIRAFLAIVEEGTLTAAAERVALAQPSLTKLLKRLEAELGAPLFERLPRGVVLTPFGERFHERARRIEAEYRFAVEELRALKNGHLPVLNIGAGPLYHMLHIPIVCEALTREFPRTRLNVVAAINRVTMPMLARGELDVVCGELSPEEQIYGVDSIPLMEAEQGIIMRRGHRLADAPMDADHLAGETWVLFQHDDRVLRALERFMGAGRHAFTVAVTTSSHATGLRIVSGSDYLMLGPAQLAPVIEEAGLLVRRPITPIRRFETGVSLRHSARSIPIVARLVELVAASTARQTEHLGVPMP
ncbi:LysR family transcriptional regulator [Prosthecomicrobium sp. N25]|uniref:LysR family transcriptional regulator n=1 Tax=Prosthecomicrobium sp. N25 TaxID=3129254 RepID=UPI0030787855